MQESACVFIRIDDDTTAEPDSQFTITMSSDDAFVEVVDPGTTTINLKDDDRSKLKPVSLAIENKYVHTHISPFLQLTDYHLRGPLTLIMRKSVHKLDQLQSFS